MANSMNHNRPVTRPGETAICFFRTSVEAPYRKALIQITESCNMRCKHCFLGTERGGRELDVPTFALKIIPALKRLRVVKVTLTGGEPFMHNKILEIVDLLIRNGIQVGICSNATLITEDAVRRLSEHKDVHINVSLDNFSRRSYGNFRGSPEHFDIVIPTLKKLAEHKLLQGILVTPNRYSSTNEYRKLCEFAKRIGARYVLMNPLSDFGRGVNSRKHLAPSWSIMEKIRNATSDLEDTEFDINYVRFPTPGLPLGSCEAGRIVYIFANGDITACPYVVFAARTNRSQYGAEEFMIGNILSDHIDDERAERASVGLRCAAHRGCLAAVIGSGQDISSGVDMDVLETPAQKAF